MSESPGLSSTSVGDSTSPLLHTTRDTHIIKSRLYDGAAGEPRGVTDPSLSQSGDCPPLRENIEEILSNMELNAFHWRVLGLVGGGYFAVCAEMMLFIFLSGPVSAEWGLGDMEFPWLPFCTGIASIVGGYIAGVCSDSYGRQPPFIAGVICLAVFGVASAFAPTFPTFIALRCTVTVGIGAFEATGFVLLLEFLPRMHRGSIMVVVTLCGALGAVFVAALAMVVLPDWGWRAFVVVCAGPAILLLLVMWPLARCSESPRFLLVSGRVEQACQVLARLRVPDCHDILRRHSTTKVTTTSVNTSNPTPFRHQLKSLFSPQLRGRTLTFTLVWLLQATGYWGVTAYLPAYMSLQLGAHARLSTFSVFIGELPGIVLAVLLVERGMLGRVWTLRVFSAATACTLLLFAAVQHHAAQASFIIGCYFSMVPIYSLLNTYTPEVYPTELRSTALAWMNVVIELPGLLTPFLGATLLSSPIKVLYPLVWAGVFLLQFLLTFALRIETAGCNLQDFHTGREECGDRGASTDNSIRC